MSSAFSVRIYDKRIKSKDRLWHLCYCARENNHKNAERQIDSEWPIDRKRRRLL